MTIGRRGVLGLGAIGLGLAALEGCGGGPRPLPAAPGGPLPVPVDKLLADLDAVVRHLSALEARETLGKGSNPNEPTRERRRTIALLSTLCFLGTYRELPEETWGDPRVEVHLAASMPRIQSALASARAHLAATTDAELTAIDARVQREPHLPMRVMERIDGYARDIDVPPDQRAYLRVSTVQLAARYRYEGTREVTRKLLSSYERLLAAKLTQLGAPAGGKGDNRSRSIGSERLAKRWPGKPLGEARESCETDDDCAEGLRCSQSVCTPQPKKLMKTAGRTAIVGLWLLLPPLCGIGVLVLLQATFIGIVASIVDDEQDRRRPPAEEGGR
jgi:hypothetical protein